MFTTWLAMIRRINFSRVRRIGKSYSHAARGQDADRFRRRDLLHFRYGVRLSRAGVASRTSRFLSRSSSLFFLLNQFGDLSVQGVRTCRSAARRRATSTRRFRIALIVFLPHLDRWRSARRAIGAFTHLFQPIALAPINILEELVRPVTLAARLFFNIFVGELLFVIIASIVNAKVSVGPVNLSIAVSILPFFIQFFNFFVGTVQAFVFTLLGIVYLSLATAEDH